jgi:hypothetical protein
LEPGTSYLTVIIEIAKPSARLVKTTAKNKNNVFKRSVNTSHDCKKLDKFLEKFANLQNI